MNPIIVLLILLFILAIAGLPSFGFLPGGYGYYPSGGLFTILVVLLVLRLLRII
jgi:hypothetical protein